MPNETTERERDTKCLPECGHDFKLEPDAKGEVKCPKCGCVNWYNKGNVFHRVER